MKYLLAVSALLMFVVPGDAQRARASQASLTRAEVKAAEQMLSDLGYWTGPIDGIFDAGSHSALLAFQKWQGRDATGELSQLALGLRYPDFIGKRGEFRMTQVILDHGVSGYFGTGLAPVELRWAGSC